MIVLRYIQCVATGDVVSLLNYAIKKTRSTVVAKVVDFTHLSVPTKGARSGHSGIRVVSKCYQTVENSETYLLSASIILCLTPTTSAVNYEFLSTTTMYSFNCACSSQAMRQYNSTFVITSQSSLDTHNTST